MRVRVGWWPGLWCTFLLLALSVCPGHLARLATAEVSLPAPETFRAAQRPAPESSRSDGGRRFSAERAPAGTIHLNFRHVDILQMISLISELTGKNFLVDDKVRGKVTVIAPQPVTPTEAYQIFLAALELQGFTVVSRGPISTIVPLRDAKSQPLPTLTNPTRPQP
jgi:general secretion pathway protein D